MNVKVLTGLILGVLLIGILVVINHKMNTEIQDMDLVRQAPQPAAVPSQPPPKPRLYGQVIRKAMLNPNRTYYESRFFVGEEEVARYKHSGEDIYDKEGTVPDGEVKFINETTGAYGIEHYQDNRRHGLYTEYYERGSLKREAEYRQGEKIKNKEYFIDGTIKLEENYEDALFFSQYRDVGKGKSYYRDGTLQYEWNLTNMDKDRYNRSYNIKGELVEENWFDDNGMLIKTARPQEGTVINHQK